MILPVWQTLGSSTHRIASELSDELNEPVTHTGTLDPLAEGVIVLLTGDDRFAKGYLPDWKKTYYFEILWGVATDSGDKLGIITTTNSYSPTSEALENVLKKFPSEYEQTIHPFSAKRIGGTSSFMLARSGASIPRASRLITLSQIEYNQKKYLTAEQILEVQSSEIEKVSGDFRQEDVLTSWQSSLSDHKQLFLITGHTVTTSAGGYIRQLVTDISEHIRVPASTWKITRTQNGPFTRIDCTENEGATLQ